MLVASSLISFEESARSLATLVASLPVSFCTFYVTKVRASLVIRKGNDLDMSFDLRSQFLEVFDDRMIDCSTEIGVVVGDDPCLVSDRIEYILLKRIFS